jgi:hypothetical protein
MSQAKNNLGRLDLPSLRYRVQTAEIPTSEGPASVGQLVFTGETSRHVTDTLTEGQDSPHERAERDEAADWLTDYQTGQGGEAPSREILKAARADRELSPSHQAIGRHWQSAGELRRWFYRPLRAAL